MRRLDIALDTSTGELILNGVRFTPSEFVGYSNDNVGDGGQRVARTVFDDLNKFKADALEVERRFEDLKRWAFSRPDRP
jgi:hypothetical protein